MFFISIPAKCLVERKTNDLTVSQLSRTDCLVSVTQMCIMDERIGITYTYKYIIVYIHLHI